MDNYPRRSLTSTELNLASRPWRLGRASDTQQTRTTENPEGTSDKQTKNPERSSDIQQTKNPERSKRIDEIREEYNKYKEESSSLKSDISEHHLEYIKEVLKKWFPNLEPGNHLETAIDIKYQMNRAGVPSVDKSEFKKVAKEALKQSPSWFKRIIGYGVDKIQDLKKYASDAKTERDFLKDYQEKMRILAEAVEKVELQRAWFKECPLCDPQMQSEYEKQHDRLKGLNGELKKLNDSTLVALINSFYRPSVRDSLGYVDSDGKINISELDGYANTLKSSAEEYPNLRDRYEIVMIELEHCKVISCMPSLEMYFPERLKCSDKNYVRLLPRKPMFMSVEEYFMTKGVSIRERVLYKESLAHNLVKPDGQRLMVPPPIESYRVVDTTEDSQSTDQKVDNSPDVKAVLEGFREGYLKAKEAQGQSSDVGKSGLPAPGGKATTPFLDGDPSQNANKPHTQEVGNKHGESVTGKPSIDLDMRRLTDKK